MMPNKAALALLLLTAFAACAEAVTYRECDFGLDCAYNKTNLCSDGRQVFFDHDVKCCNCGYAPGCFGCTSSSSDCYSYSCPVESWIIIVAIVVPVGIIFFIILIVVCCCCCCAAAAAASQSHNSVSGTTVVVTQPQPVEEVYVEAAPQYVQTNHTVELQPVGTDAYGQPVYHQQPPPPQYATYSY